MSGKMDFFFFAKLTGLEAPDICLNQKGNYNINLYLDSFCKVAWFRQVYFFLNRKGAIVISLFVLVNTDTPTHP